MELLKSKNIIISIVLAATFIYSCKPKTSNPTNSQEVITTVRLLFTDTLGHVQSAMWKDPDGAGGVSPTIDTIKLASGMNYKCKVEMLDESKTPIQNISDEVAKEREAHQFFYTPSNTLSGKVTFTITDFDANNLPVGLSFNTQVQSTSAIQGSLHVVLSHYEVDVPKTTAPSAESDVDIDFQVLIQ
jgi:hypothetical protein